jgi:hypothetical protein
MLIKFTADAAVGGGVGFLVGAFTPAVGRKVKAAFVALAKKVVAKADAEAKVVEADVKAKV